MKQDKFSLIATVFNEEATIKKFIESVLSQSKLPDEIIIVDGGSKDKTISEIQKISLASNKLKIKIIVKRGNRSVGRNEAVKHANGNIILCTDAGNTLDKNWVREISKPFNDIKVDVVAGYYKGAPQNIFQKCLVPYVLVMKDKVDKNNFLPATRSMAFRKLIWKKAGGFDENLSHNEDYVFANKLKVLGARIVFAGRAIVYWSPQKNLREAFVMFLRFAFGDAEAGIIRDKVLLIYARYIFFAYLIIITFLIKSFLLYLLIPILFFLYILWSINKNYKYVSDPKGFVVLPTLQIVSDIAVLLGTSLGIVKGLAKTNYLAIIKNNFILVGLILVYIISMLIVINSGIPNSSHPFNYQMDEWHQFQAVRTVLTLGTPNVTGSANGTMFNFFISGVMLVPFYLLKIINPFSIKSAVDSLFEQQKIFILLRLFTLFFGTLALIYLAKIAKLLKINQGLTVSLFIFTPVWLVLSNFFKYDIALTFWVTLSLYYLISYSRSPSRRNFIISSFTCGMALAVKVSAIPLLPMLVFAFFLFGSNFKKNYVDLFLGIIVYLFATIFFGIPDVVFGGRNMNDYLFSNVVSGPSELIRNYNLGNSLLNLTFLHKLPEIFGHVLYLITIISIICIAVILIRAFLNRDYFQLKLKGFLFLSFILFCISLIPLRITISANRAVVLLPFVAILTALVFRELFSVFKNKKFLAGGLCILLIMLFSVQVFESYLWVQLKISNLPEQASSVWIIKNIPAHSSIGLENVPIYQFEPDYILKEFYDRQYHPASSTNYNYHIINSMTKNLPQYIILSNVNYELKYLKQSPKNDLVKRIKLNNYSEIAYFPLEIPYYKYFDNYYDYPFVGVFAYPDGISVYEKK
jgi:glycosyltransferase involved in cell wall biosynthesis